MDEKTKKGALIAVVIVAVLAAIVTGIVSLGGPRGEAGEFMGDEDAPPPKEQMMDAEQRGVEADPGT
jgi:hypothetical protein